MVTRIQTTRKNELCSTNTSKNLKNRIGPQVLEGPTNGRNDLFTLRIAELGIEYGIVPQMLLLEPLDRLCGKMDINEQSSMKHNYDQQQPAFSRGSSKSAASNAYRANEYSFFGA